MEQNILENITMSFQEHSLFFLFLFGSHLVRKITRKNTASNCLLVNSDLPKNTKKDSEERKFLKEFSIYLPSIFWQKFFRKLEFWKKTQKSHMPVNNQKGSVCNMFSEWQFLLSNFRFKHWAYLFTSQRGHRNHWIFNKKVILLAFKA